MDVLEVINFFNKQYPDKKRGIAIIVILNLLAHNQIKKKHIAQGVERNPKQQLLKKYPMVRV